MRRSALQVVIICIFAEALICSDALNSQIKVAGSSNDIESDNALFGNDGGWSPANDDNNPSLQITLLDDPTKACGIVSFSLELVNVDRIDTEVRYLESPDIKFNPPEGIIKSPKDLAIGSTWTTGEIDIDTPGFTVDMLIFNISRTEDQLPTVTNAGFFVCCRSIPKKRTIRPPETTVTGTLPPGTTVTGTMPPETTVTGTIPPETTVTGTLPPETTVTGTLPPETTVTGTIPPETTVTGTIPPETTVTGTIPPETTLTGTIPPETTVTGTIPPGTTVTGTIPPETTVTGTLPPETTITGTIPPETTVTGTIPPETTVTGTIPPPEKFCPRGEFTIVLTTGKKDLDLKIKPNSGKVNPSQSLLNSGEKISVKKDDVIIITSKDGDFFRLMDLQFKTIRATDIAVTIMVSGEDDQTFSFVPVSKETEVIINRGDELPSEGQNFVTEIRISATTTVKGNQVEIQDLFARACNELETTTALPVTGTIQVTTAAFGCRDVQNSQLIVKGSSNDKKSRGALLGEGGQWTPTQNDRKPFFQVKLIKDPNRDCGLFSFTLSVTNVDKIDTQVKYTESKDMTFNPPEGIIKSPKEIKPDEMWSTGAIDIESPGFTVDMMIFSLIATNKKTPIFQNAEFVVCCERQEGTTTPFTGTTVTGTIPPKTTVTGTIPPETTVTGTIPPQTTVTGTIPPETTVTGTVLPETTVTGTIPPETTVTGTIPPETTTQETGRFCPSGEFTIVLTTGKKDLKLNISPNSGKVNPGLSLLNSEDKIPLKKDDVISITARDTGDFFRLMDLQFTTIRATDIVVTISIQGEDDKVVNLTPDTKETEVLIERGDELPLEGENFVTKITISATSSVKGNQVEIKDLFVRACNEIETTTGLPFTGTATMPLVTGTLRQFTTTSVLGCRDVQNSQLVVKASSNDKKSRGALLGEGDKWVPTQSDNKPFFQVKLIKDPNKKCGLFSFKLDITNVDKIDTEVKYTESPDLTFNPPEGIIKSPRDIKSDQQWSTGEIDIESPGFTVDMMIFRLTPTNKKTPVVQNAGFVVCCKGQPGTTTPFSGTTVTGTLPPGTTITGTIPPQTTITGTIPPETTVTGTIPPETTVTGTIPPETTVTGTIPPETTVTGTIPPETTVTGTIPPKTTVTGTIPPETTVTGTIPPETTVTGTIPPETTITGTIPPETTVTGTIPPETTITGTVPPGTTITGLIPTTTPGFGCRDVINSQLEVKASSNDKKSRSALVGESGSWSPMKNDNNPTYEVDVVKDPRKTCGLISFNLTLTNIDKIDTEVIYRESPDIVFNPPEGIIKSPRNIRPDKPWSTGEIDIDAPGFNIIMVKFTLTATKRKIPKIDNVGFVLCCQPKQEGTTTPFSGTTVTGTLPPGTTVTGTVPPQTTVTGTIPPQTTVTGTIPPETTVTGTIPEGTTTENLNRFCPAREFTIVLTTGKRDLDYDISPNTGKVKPGLGLLNSEDKIQLRNNDIITISSKESGDTFRLMDIQFTAIRATDVIVTIVVPGSEDEVFTFKPQSLQTAIMIERRDELPAVGLDGVSEIRISIASSEKGTKVEMSDLFVRACNELETTTPSFGTTLAGTTVTGTIPPETTVTGTIPPETTVTGTIPPETTITGTIQPQTTITGTLPPETTVTGTLPPETTVTGTLPPETTVTGTVPTETTTSPGPKCGTAEAVDLEVIASSNNDKASDSLLSESGEWSPIKSDEIPTLEFTLARQPGKVCEMMSFSMELTSVDKLDTETQQRESPDMMFNPKQGILKSPRNLRPNQRWTTGVVDLSSPGFQIKKMIFTFTPPNKKVPIVKNIEITICCVPGGVPGTTTVAPTVTGTLPPGTTVTGTIPPETTITGTIPPETTVTGTIPPETTVTGTIPPETTVTGTIPPETTVTGTIPPETTATGTIPPETTVTGTIPPETTATGTIPPETTVTGTIPPETTVTGTIPPETTVTGTIPPETTVTGTIPPETTVTGTIPPETTVTGTIPPETTVTGTIPPETTVTGTIPPETTVTGTIPPGTTVTGTIPPETTVTGTIAPETTVTGTIPEGTTVTGSIEGCPSAYLPVELLAENIPEDFVVNGIGPFGAKEPSGQPKENVLDAVKNSGGSLRISEEDQIIVKPWCMAALINEVSFRIQGVNKAIVLFRNAQDQIIEEQNFRPARANKEEDIVIDKSFEGVNNIIFKFKGSKMTVRNIYVLGCCERGGPPNFPPTAVIPTKETPPLTTTEGECESGYELTTSENSREEFDIDITPNKKKAKRENAWQGESSITITSQDSVSIAPTEGISGYFILLEVSFMITVSRTPASVKITLLNSDGNQVEVDGNTLSIINENKETPVVFEGNYQNIVLITLTFTGKGDVKISDLLVVACTHKEEESTTNIPEPRTTTVVLNGHFTTTAAGVCKFDLKDYVDNFGKPPKKDVIGWVEKDNVPGLSSPEEEFEIGDLIESSTVIHVDCNNCTCRDDLSIRCTNIPCINDCAWESWSEWTDCDRTCDGGMRVRARGFTQSLFNGKKCIGEFLNPEWCETPNCPIDCEWGSWSNWGSCSKTCETTTKIRRRKILNPAEYGGKECDGSFIEERDCNIVCDECPPGKTKKERCNCPKTCLSIAFPDSCVEPDSCQISCECPEGYVEDIDGTCVQPSKCSCLDIDGTVFEEEQTFITKDGCEKCTCKDSEIDCTPLPDCDCTWGDWGRWSSCNKNCDGGQRRRTRSVLTKSRGAGDECKGGKDEIESCNTAPCPMCVINGKEYNTMDIISQTECGVCVCNERGKKECQNIDKSGELGICKSYICVDGERKIIDEADDCPTDCPPGWVSAPLVNDCCHCEPPSNENCQLVEKTKFLTVVDNTGEECVTSKEVVLTHCNGSCGSSDSFSVAFVRDDGTRLVTDSEHYCKCCTGDGEPYQVDVKCGKAKRKQVIEITQFTRCTCKGCDETAEKRRR